MLAYRLLKQQRLCEKAAWAEIGEERLRYEQKREHKVQTARQSCFGFPAAAVPVRPRPRFGAGSANGPAPAASTERRSPPLRDQNLHNADNTAAVLAAKASPSVHRVTGNEPLHDLKEVPASGRPFARTGRGHDGARRDAAPIIASRRAPSLIPATGSGGAAAVAAAAACATRPFTDAVTTTATTAPAETEKKRSRPRKKDRTAANAFLRGVVVCAVPHADAVTLYKIKSVWQKQVKLAGGILLRADQYDAAAVTHVVANPKMPPGELAASLHNWSAPPAAAAGAVAAVAAGAAASASGHRAACARFAAAPGKLLLDYRWLIDCIKEGRRVQEASYGLASGGGVPAAADSAAAAATAARYAAASSGSERDGEGEDRSGKRRRLRSLNGDDGGSDSDAATPTDRARRQRFRGDGVGHRDSRKERAIAAAVAAASATIPGSSGAAWDGPATLLPPPPLPRLHLSRGSSVGRGQSRVAGVELAPPIADKWPRWMKRKWNGDSTWRRGGGGDDDDTDEETAFSWDERSVMRGGTIVRVNGVAVEPRDFHAPIDAREADILRQQRLTTFLRPRSAPPMVGPDGSGAALARRGAFACQWMPPSPP
ncbi:unnamed protein product, partial [Phaeothamnion confervicola]